MTTIDGSPAASPDEPYATYAGVGAIIEIDPCVVADAVAMVPFIAAANAAVVAACTGTAGPTPEYNDTRLALIETWLAAHFYAQRDPRYTTEKAADVAVGYQSKVDLGFDNTHYGQMAMRLDTNGGLAKLNDEAKKGGRPRVGVTWLGTTEVTKYPGY